MPERQEGAPGKSGRAIFALYSPSPPLGSFTKEMQAFVFLCPKQKALPRSIRNVGGLLRPISSEPTPSHRPWASARARPLADLDASNTYRGKQ